MKNIKTYISIAAFSFLVMGLPAIASAQWYPNGNNYPNNGGYGNNNGYYGNVQGAVRDLKQRARSFERQTDNNDRYNNGGYGNNGGWGNNRNGSYTNSNIEDIADDFSKAASRLEDKFGRGRNLNNSRDEAQRVLQLGSQLDRELRRMRSSNNLRNEWNMIENDLQIIANAYGINYNSGRNRGWGNGRGNTRGNNMPSWWPF
ncbi:MAG: hypothetical protein KA956_08595 [Pyrinomonadaceae bacterium]|nr:hypothetical protein [Pyrinomonadaceae bacterium]